MDLALGRAESSAASGNPAASNSTEDERIHNIRFWRSPALKKRGGLGGAEGWGARPPVAAVGRRKGERQKKNEFSGLGSAPRKYLGEKLEEGCRHINPPPMIMGQGPVMARARIVGHPCPGGGGVEVAVQIYAQVAHYLGAMVHWCIALLHYLGWQGCRWQSRWKR